jgi:outer membrane lipoprotein carrier protein
MHRPANRGNRALTFLGLLSYASCASSVFAGPSPGAPQLRFEQTYRAAQSLQVLFYETYQENGQVVRSEAGTAYFRRPGKMRFDYAAPEKNIFLMDGKTVWFYVPADHTVTRVPAKASSDWKTPLALLTGAARLSRICAGVELSTAEKPTVPDGVVLQCRLKSSAAEPQGTPAAAKSVTSEPTASLVFLEVSQTSGQLARVLIRDSGGVTIEFQFKDWQFNPLLPESLFRFTPPLDTAVVNGNLAERSGATALP